MIYINSSILIVDNTGAKEGSCIRITKRKKAILGDLILVSLKRVRPNIKLRRLKKKVKKGDLWHAYVLRDKNPIRRIGSHYIKYGQTGVILFKNHEEMAGSRIYGPVHRELYNKKYFSICSFII